MKLIDLSGRVAFVTGESGGIGKGMALGLAGAGRNESKTAAAVAELEALGAEALGLQCDILSRAEVERAIGETEEQFGRLDSLINDAGSGRGRKCPK